MLAILFLVLFLSYGLYISNSTLKNFKPLEQIWIGISLGFLMAMVLPSAFAMIFSFSYLSHVLSSLLGLLLCFITSKNKQKQLYTWDRKETQRLMYSMICVLPLAILMTYLQYTHNLRLGENGSYSAGQSTFGDLSLHLGIITSAKGAKFPMEYNIFPGQRLCYPFLIDTLSTSLYLLGMSLPHSIVIPGSIICANIFFGYYLLAEKILKHKSIVFLAFLLLFINGGLGFVYKFDQIGDNFQNMINENLNGFYKTPTNMPSEYNIVWANLICDLLLPQRTFMAGWLILFPCLYIVITPFLEDRLHAKSELMLLIFMAMFLPMINTHAFLALGIFSIVQLFMQTLYSDKQIKKQRFLQFIIFGIFTLIGALPQLIIWTFSQVSANSHFLSFSPNWINYNPATETFRDFYPWFYLKNIGLIVIPIFFALFTKDKKHRTIIFGAYAILILAELIIFQPNRYDNNKLIYVMYALSLPIACDYLAEFYIAIKKIRFHRIIAFIFLFCSFVSAGMSIAREIVSNYEIYSKEDISLAKYIEENTEKDALFMTSQYHHNPVAALAGRNILCGTGIYLYYHGIDITKRTIDIQNFYINNDLSVIEKNKIDYILLSNSEIMNYNIQSSEFFDNNFNLIYSDGSNKLYKVNK